MDDVHGLAAELVEAVRTEDEAWVRQILMCDLAGEVAVEVARTVVHTREAVAANDERDRRLRNVEADYRLAGEANRKLITERAELRRRVEELRAMKGIA